MTLAGKTIAITGAARGLGAALAIVAGDRGMLPLLLGRSPGRLTAIAGVIEARTGRRPDYSQPIYRLRCSNFGR
ncbi:hypothetical protein [Devosia sp.]|uniref:hypothetical protein n=1 Tax=Devosia sp. TaxID=1871048 RepID=UPI002FC8DE33